MTLYPAMITGLRCPVSFAVDFLGSLPLNNLEAEGDNPGPDLKFWSHVARWSLDLMARGKFIPAIATHGNRFTAQWRPLLDSAQDHERFQFFVRRMPTSDALLPAQLWQDP